jgi:hypothetical protein
MSFYTIDALKLEIESQRAVIADPGRYREHRAVELALEDLREQLRVAEAEYSGVLERRPPLGTAEAAKVVVPHREAQAAPRDELRCRFLAGKPAATEADFERPYPQMRDEELLRRREQAQARACSTARRFC